MAAVGDVIEPGKYLRLYTPQPEAGARHQVAERGVAAVFGHDDGTVLMVSG